MTTYYHDRWADVVWTDHARERAHQRAPGWSLDQLVRDSVALPSTSARLYEASRRRQGRDAGHAAQVYRYHPGADVMIALTWSEGITTSDRWAVVTVLPVSGGYQTLIRRELGLPHG